MPYKDPEAKRAYNRAYALAHPEKGKQARRAYRLRHPDRARAQYKKDYWADPEKKRGKRRAYYLEHVDVQRATSKAYNIAHRDERREYTSRYFQAFPALKKAHDLKRRTRKRGLPYTFTIAETSFCRAYFYYACAVCENEEGFQWAIAMDHWIPLASLECPGTIATNMIPLCHGVGGCNNSKIDTLPEPWLIKRFGPRKAAHILKKIHAYFALVAPKEDAA